MEIAVNTLFVSFNPKIISHKKSVINGFIPNLNCKRSYFSRPLRFNAQELCIRKSHECVPAVCAVLSGAEDVGVSPSQFDDFSVTTGPTEGRELKVSVEVSGSKTRAIFDKVFDEMVAAAQPIPGFRRVKGGKTPNIPRDILLEVLGPSKVYKQVIQEVINSAIAQYVEKEGLKVGKDLRVEQSFEDLEAAFEADEKFSFDAVIQLKAMN